MDTFLGHVIFGAEQSYTWRLFNLMISHNKCDLHALPSHSIHSQFGYLLSYTTDMQGNMISMLVYLVLNWSCHGNKKKI